MNKFLIWGHTTSQQEIHLPNTEIEFSHVLDRYNMVGLPGCLGSIDCVHLIWNNCPVVIKSQCQGKEKFPTLAFQVVVSHTRKIMLCSQPFYGSVNDKTICRYDKTIRLMKKDEKYMNRQWHCYDKDGNIITNKGMYFICDGGYHHWKMLIPPYKHQPEGSDLSEWSENIESKRKDIECTFGIVKKDT